MTAGFACLHCQLKNKSRQLKLQPTRSKQENKTNESKEVHNQHEQQ